MDFMPRVNSAQTSFNDAVEKWCPDRDKTINRDIYWEVNRKIPPTDCSGLTDDILALRKNGSTIMEIAAALGVSRTTVKKYLTRSD